MLMMKTLKLFLTIFFAVFFANLASHFAAALFVATGLSQVAESLQDQGAAPQVQLSAGLAKDLERLNSQYTEAANNVRTPEQQRALENDFRLCKSWQQMYLKDRDEISKMHRDAACKRANSH